MCVRAKKRTYEKCKLLTWCHPFAPSVSVSNSGRNDFSCIRTRTTCITCKRVACFTLLGPYNFAFDNCPMLCQCWSTVYDGGPTLTKYWTSVCVCRIHTFGDDYFRYRVVGDLNTARRPVTPLIVLRNLMSSSSREGAGYHQHWPISSSYSANGNVLTSLTNRYLTSSYSTKPPCCFLPLSIPRSAS